MTRILAAPALLGFALASSSTFALEQAAGPVSFARDIAPILLEHCDSCHRPDGPAPFSLTTYDDAKRRARQIAEVTKSRYMPPWKPEPGYGEFVAERLLTEAQIELIERWVQGGALEGERGDVPQLQTWPVGWQLGQPDLVLTLPEYVLAPGGEGDVFRNFAVPVPITGTRYVRGLEFRPDNRSIHHANIFVDRTPTSRRLDEEDPLPGYKGLISRSAMFPDGHFLGWTPGQAPPLGPDRLAWRLDAGSDLLVQLHLQSTGKAEGIQPSIGLFFADEPPTEIPVIVRLGRQSHDIPPGEKAYVVRDSYDLPVEAEVHAVQPHAHYRASEVRAWALLPDGTRRWLIYIRKWDFNWQDQYRYRTPFWLPAGTTLNLEYTYDNSADNPRNPDVPPKRVVWGFRSADEMGDLWVQLMTGSEQEMRVLARDSRRKMITEDIVGLETQIRVNPDYAAIRNDAALLYIENGQADRAVPHFEQVTRLEPHSAAAQFNLGNALEAAGKRQEAVARYREAVKLDPTYVRAHAALANALFLQGQAKEATAHYRELARLDPTSLEAHFNLGSALMAVGRFNEALPALRRALELKNDFPEAHYNLARVYANLTQTAEAVRHLRAAVELRADWLPALGQLAWLLATHADAGVLDPEEAVRLATRAAELSRGADAEILDSLAAAYAAAGRFEDAVRTAAEAAALAARSSPDLAAQIRARLGLYRNGQRVVISGR